MTPWKDTVQGGRHKRLAVRTEQNKGQSLPKNRLNRAVFCSVENIDIYNSS